MWTAFFVDERTLSFLYISLAFCVLTSDGFTQYENIGFNFLQIRYQVILYKSVYIWRPLEPKKKVYVIDLLHSPCSSPTL